MYILGIDPGLAIVGWGVIEYKNAKFRTVAYGSMRTAAGLPTHERLAEIDRQLDEIIEKYKPDELSIEELFWNTNQKTGIRVSEARGVVLLCARKHGLEIAEYTPLQDSPAIPIKLGNPAPEPIKTAS